MKYAILFPLFAFACLALPAQQDLRLTGVVVEQNSQFNTGTVRYLPDAEIKSLGNSTTSDIRGQFALVFADKPMGSTAWVHTAKQGYELVNKKEMENVSIIGRTTPMKVVMCPAGQLYDNQVTYYEIARDAKVQAYYKRIAILEKEGLEKEALLRQFTLDFNVHRLSADSARMLLHQQFQAAQAQAQQLADQFVTVNLDDQSATYQRAFRAFLAKDIEGAIRILDSADLGERLERNHALVAKIETIILEKLIVKDSALKQIRQDMEHVVFSARMHKLEYRFGEADSLYRLALRLIPDSLSLNLKREYAGYLHELGQYEEAKGIYLIVVEQYRKMVKQTHNSYLSDYSIVLMNLADCLLMTNSVQPACLCYMEAIRIVKKFSRKDPDENRTWLAQSLLRAGFMLVNVREHEEGHAYLKEALGVWRKLAKDKSEASLFGLADNLIALGYSYSISRNYNASSNCFKNGVSILRILESTGCGYCGEKIASALNFLGNLHLVYNEDSLANEHYLEALQRYRALAQKDPKANLSNVAMLLHNLGILSGKKEEFLIAITRLQESLSILEELSQHNMRDCRIQECGVVHSLALAYWNLFEISGKPEHRSRCIELFEKALCFLDACGNGYYSRYYEVISKNHKDFLTECPESLHGGEKLFELRAAADSASSIEEKVRLQQTLVRFLDSLIVMHPGSPGLTPRLVKAYGNLAFSLLLHQDFFAAEDAARKGQELAPSEEILGARLALALLYQGRWREARDIYIRFINQPDPYAIYRDTLLEDLDELEQAGITHPDVKKVRKLLR